MVDGECCQRRAGTRSYGREEPRRAHEQSNFRDIGGRRGSLLFLGQIDVELLSLSAFDKNLKRRRERRGEKRTVTSARSFLVEDSVGDSASRVRPDGGEGKRHREDARIRSEWGTGAHLDSLPSSSRRDSALQLIFFFFFNSPSTRGESRDRTETKTTEGSREKKKMRGKNLFGSEMTGWARHDGRGGRTGERLV